MDPSRFESTEGLPFQVDQLSGGQTSHHCVIVELNVPSYRVEQAKKSRPAPAATE